MTSLSALWRVRSCFLSYIQLGKEVKLLKKGRWRIWQIQTYKIRQTRISRSIELSPQNMSIQSDQEQLITVSYQHKCKNWRGNGENQHKVHEVSVNVCSQFPTQPIYNLEIMTLTIQETKASTLSKFLYEAKLSHIHHASQFTTEPKKHSTPSIPKHKS